MRLVIDMNLAPAWADHLGAAGHDAVHWSTVGAANAPDTEVMDWAARNDRVLITNDLDFGALLAASGDVSPSVVQVRSGSLALSEIGGIVLDALARAEEDLRAGALLTLDTGRARLRVLPLVNRSQSDSSNG